MKREFQYIVAVVVTISILALSIWMPSAFVSKQKQEENPPITAKERADLALKYINLPASINVEQLDSENLEGQISPEVLNLILSKLEKLTSGLLAQPVPGSLYPEKLNSSLVLSKSRDLVRIGDFQGRSMRILRIYIEWDTDWHNWMQVIFDADTGDVCFFYSSSVCRSGFDKYGKLTLPEDPLKAAKLFGEYLGADEIVQDDSTSWSGNVEDAATVVYKRLQQEMEYKIFCNYIPQKLFDCKIIMVR